MERLHKVDILFICIYLVICLIIGFKKSLKVKNITDYTVGDRDFSTMVLVSTIFASYIGAAAVFGKVEKIYTLGFYYVIGQLFFPIYWLIVGKIFAGNITKFHGCKSLADIMQVLYGNNGRWITNIITLIGAIGTVGLQVKVTSHLFNFMGIDSFWAIIASYVALTCYSAFGGIRAVAFTDVFQFLTFFFVLPLVCGIALHKNNGVIGIINKLPNDYLSFSLNSADFFAFISLLLYTLVTLVDAPMIQRLFLTKSKEQLKSVFRYVAIVSIPFSLMVCFIGLVVKSTYFNIDPGDSLLYFLTENVPPFLLGIVISGLLAVIMSTGDTWLNNASVIFAYDVLGKGFIIGEKKLLTIARISTFVISIFSAILALSTDGVEDLVWLINNFWCPILFLPLVIGVLGLRSNSTSFLVSTIFAITSVLITAYITGVFDTKSLMFGIIFSTIGLLGTHYIQVKKGIIKKNLKKIEKGQNFLMAFTFKLNRWLSNFLDIKKQIETNKSSYYAFSIFVLFYYIPSAVLQYQPNLNLTAVFLNYLHYLSLLLALFLLFHESYTKKDPKFLWYMNLFVTLSFTNSYFFFAGDDKIIIFSSFLLSIIILHLLINKVYALLLNFFGILSGYLIWKLQNIYIPDSGFITEVQKEFIWYYVISLIIFVAYIIYVKIKEASTQQNSLRTFGHAIAHDVLTPLSVGLMAIDMIEMALKEKDYDNVLRFTKYIRESNKKSMQEIDIMLKTMDADSDIEDWGRYGLIKTVLEIVKDYYMTEKQKESIFLFKSGITDNKIQFIGSPILLKHVIFNLLKNAFKYAGENAKIEIYLDEYVQLHIKDDGYGIKEEVMKNIFNKFVTTSGHGIGLKFCHEAMNKMYGEIVCYSKVGEGTDFILSFNR